jgi:phosphatidate phosphatase PAH1
MTGWRQVLRRSRAASIVAAAILIAGWATTSARVAAETERHAVVVDIDGVLTTYQLLDYGPTNGIFLDLGVAYARRDAALLMNLFHRKGYDIVYLAGRPANLKVNGMSMGDATWKWLRDEGFPTEPDRTTLLLQDGPASVTDAANRGEAMAEYMGAQGTDLVTGMLATLKKAKKITYDYGYCDSDVVVKAFLNAGIPAGHIYTIGNKGVSRLGFMGSRAIIGRESNPGFTRHIREFVIPGVPRR